MKNKVDKAIHPNTHELTDEILRITTIIQTDFPSFYSTLAETPYEVNDIKMKPKNQELAEYLEFLKTQLLFFQKHK